jgi:ankyrin repeat protein
VEVVRVLLKHGANVKIANKNGFTPLTTAANKGHTDVVRELQEHSASADNANN